MGMGKATRSSAGAIRLGVLDVLVAVILLAVLLYASWKQFPAYERNIPARSIAPDGNPRSKPFSLRR
jgi:hypothetical protein